MKNDKSHKNKYIWVSVLLISYTICLAQQVLLNRVLCYKTDGSVDLELSYWGLQCECKKKRHDHECSDKNHNHKEKSHNRTENGKINGVCPAVECCFDVPVDEGLLKRESGNHLTDSTFIGLYNPFDAAEILLHDPFISSPKQIPLSKFLNTSLFQYSTVILRC